MIYATGDTHGGFQRFQPEYFPEQKEMSKDDYVIICGDFGGIWNGDEEEQRSLDWLESLPFTTLFVDGNHENYDLLNAYPVELWNGGKIHRIRPHVIHLMRGQVFNIDGYTFFTMGGAQSHDIKDGILDPDAPDFKERYREMKHRLARFRVNHISWWEQELPSDEEYEEARSNLERVDYAVDYIITHCAPNSIVSEIGMSSFDPLTDFLEEAREKAKFHYWLFGHYHDNKNIGDQFVLLWEQIVRVI